MRKWKWHLLLSASLLACGVVQASSPITPHAEYHKRIRTGEMVSPLTSELLISGEASVAGTSESSNE